MRHYRQVTVSCASSDEAQAIMSDIMSERLAATAQTWPMSTTYWRKDTLVQVEEHHVLFKTLRPCVDLIVARICELHSGEQPSVSIIPVEQLGPENDDWMDNAVRNTSRHLARIAS